MLIKLLATGESNLKVIHINTYDTGGAATAMLALHNSLKSKGIDSKILVRFKWSDNPDIHVFGFITPSVTTRIIRRLSGWKSRDKSNKEQLAKYEFERDLFTFPESDQDICSQQIFLSADIIHLHWVADFIDYPSFFSKINKPVIWTLHDKGPAMGGFHLLTDYERNINNKVLELENKLKQIKVDSLKKYKNITLISPSRTLKKFFERDDIFNHYPNHLIYNGVDPVENKLLDKIFCRKVLGLPSDKIIFLFLNKNNQGYHKGFDILNKVILKFQPENSIHFIVAGDTLKESGRMYDNVTNVESVTGRYEKNILYCASDGLIIPSREENLPNIMLEAFMCGVPIISFNIGGMGEILKNNNFGISAGQVSEINLINAIKNFIDNINRFKKEFIREFAIENFDIKTQCDKYIDIYKSILL